MKRIISLALLLSLSACSQESALSIDDAKNAGFIPKNQQMFQMVGAVDGWSGSWAGETVELYQYDNASDTKTPFFDGIKPSSWASKCIHKNMVLISKGINACTELESM